VSEEYTQTPPTWTREKSTQISQGPTCDRGTEMPPVMTGETSTQMTRPILKDRGTSTTTVTFKMATCQTKVYFDNSEIPPGAPRPTLPWGYGYQQFDSLLAAYPEVHPEDFVTFGILQEQPRRGTIRDWGEVATVLAHMIGGRRTLVNELVFIVNRIQRLDRGDPMRAVEEQTLVDVLLRERRRSAMPLGEASFPQLEAPGGPLGRPAQPGPTGAPRDPRRRSPHRQKQETHLGHQAPREDQIVLHHPSLGPQGPRGDIKKVEDPHLDPQGPRVDHVVPRPVSPTWSISPPTQTRRTGTRHRQPPPPVSEDGSSDGADMDTDDEDALLYTGQRRQSDHSSDGFEHI